jgi:hypothetical protein
MEPEMNSENWTPPNENQDQQGTCPQPEQKSFFQQERLQQTWLNVKLATWIKCLIVIAALFITAAVIAPKLTTAQSQQQNTSECYFEFEDGWSDEYSDEYYDNWCDDNYKD